MGWEPSGVAMFVGKNGSAKTLAMVRDIALPSFRRGRPVLANLTLFASPADRHLPTAEREPHPLWVPLTTWHQLHEVELGTAILLDEITAVFSSRESAKMPTQVVTALRQLRKTDAIMGLSDPSWDRCDKSIRECIDEVVVSRGYFPEAVPGRRRKAKRVFRHRVYDVQDFGSEFSLDKAKSSRADSPRPHHTSWYLRKRHDHQHLYDTFESVGLLDHLDEYGQCITCGGTRRRPPCVCPEYLAKLPEKSRR